jgi:hypothetical protein
MPYAPTKMEATGIQNNTRNMVVFITKFLHFKLEWNEAFEENMVSSA